MTEQGTVYAAFFERRLADEWSRRSALEARATAVVTSSAALVSLIFVLVAVVIGKDTVFVSGAKWLVIAALALFAGSALAALFAGQLKKYTVPHPDDLRSCLAEHWVDTETSARLACAWMDFDTITTLRAGNNVKVWWLDVALKTQFAAVVVLAVAVAWEIF